nr:hypothetical protein [Candidatus Sigynarchaeota archaeon]
METSKIPATSKYSEQDEVIINNSSPFSRIKYLRTQTIETFVGRENELVALTEMLANVVTTDSAFGVKISGPPASGKSTLFGYFATLVKTGEIFKMPYCRLKKGDASVKISFIDAPKEELMSARFFWKSMILSWDEEKFDFLEIFAAGFMLKALIVLYENGFNQGEIKPLLLMLHPNLDTELTRHPLREVLDLDIYIEKFIDRATSDGNFLAKSRAMIYNGFRVLQKHTVQIRENKVQLRIEKPYIDNLVDMLSVDLEKQSNAKCRLIGDVDELFKSDTQVINLLNWFIETLCWVEEKQACFVIGIDNIGYLTEELENKNQIYSTFVQTILQLRNRLKGFLFVFIGTTTDWDGFNKFVNSDKDLPGQLVGFFTRIIELVRLNETETRKALTQLITSFWFNRKKTLPPGNPCYPFSPDFFTYLYDLKTHNYREMLTLLNQIWDIYKRALVVIPLVNPFDMIRFVHFDMMSSGRRDIVFSNLVPWEQERILAWFDSIESSFKAKDQSKMVEQTLVDCFEILMAEDAPRQVRLVSKQAIKVLKDDGSE